MGGRWGMGEEVEEEYEEWFIWLIGVQTGCVL
jgi:hypothetical protein